MYFGLQLKQVLPTNVALGGANMGQVPMFQTQWWSNRLSIPSGYVAADGQELSKAVYPSADQGIQAGIVPLIDESTWQSTPRERGKYVATSSTGNFRVPDYNGKYAGSFGAVFLRGDGALSEAVAGIIQRDAMQGHKHSGGFAFGGSANLGNLAQYIQSVDTSTPISDGVNGTPRTATETRPLNVTGCWIIKLFGSVVNGGAVDAGQLATAYSDIVTRLQPFVSTAQTISAAGLLTIPHGFSTRPRSIVIDSECLIADQGWSVGDFVYDISALNVNANGAISISADNTNIYIRFGTSAPSMPHKTTGAGGSMTFGRWSAIVRATQ